jgi:hypothetical protein
LSDVLGGRMQSLFCFFAGQITIATASLDVAPPAGSVGPTSSFIL